MAAKPKGDKGHALEGYYVGLNSLLDFGRQMASFGGNARHTNAIKKGDKYRIFTIGEKINNVRLLYYFDVDDIASFAVYNPGVDSKESFQMRDTAGNLASAYQLYRSPIVEVAKNPYKVKDSAKGMDKVELVEVKDYKGMVKALVNSATMSESPASVYAFFYKSAHYIGTFELFHESGSKVFAYARLDTAKTFISLGYNYNEGSVSVSDTFGERSSFYVSVVNLADTPPFFKPQQK